MSKIEEKPSEYDHIIVELETIRWRLVENISTIDESIKSLERKKYNYMRSEGNERQKGKNNCRNH